MPGYPSRSWFAGSTAQLQQSMRYEIPDAPRPFCDAERRDLHSHAGACGTIISTIVRHSASHAFPDAPRPHRDAERRDLHSHAGACGTIISTIVRRSASHAFPDAAPERRDLHSRAGACGTIISTIVRRSASHAFPDAPRPLATQSVETCIPTLERGNENPTIVRRSASHAVLDALRPLDDAERRDLHSHAGACGTIISTIVPDALRFCLKGV